MILARPRRIVTSFKFHTICGKAAQNKGMALLPRKINGNFVMLSLQDGVNNYIIFSDSVRFWNEAELLQEPVHPLKFVQVGNCGSPVETAAKSKGMASSSPDRHLGATLVNDTPSQWKRGVHHEALSHWN